MPRRRPRPRSLSLLTVLALAGCGTSPLVLAGTPPPSASGVASPSPSSTSTGTSSSSSASSGTGIIAFTRCTGATAPPTSMCGSLTVPLDYSDASKGTIKIPTIKVPATSTTQRIGSLLVNPGGPGASGVQFVEDAFSPSSSGPGLFASLNQRFDIVGFDPRGTGDPDAVSCLTTAQLDAVVAADPIADDPAEKQVLVDTSKLVGPACQQKVGRLLPYVGTDNVARDLDGLRAALGDNKLSYFGFSYGTKIGSVYAQMFPTHIRAMVLDGDVDSSISLIAQTEQQADGLAVNYQEFLRRCTAAPPCAMGANPGAAITALLNQLDARPAPSDSGRTVGRGQALVALLASMYDARIWDQVATIFGQAISSGDVTGLQLLSDLYTGRHATGYDHQLESNLAIDCVDEKVPLDLATYDTEAAKTEARDPFFGDAGVYGSLPCAYWPLHGSDPKPVSVSGAPPIVLIGATNDPATPYAWSQGLQKHIQGSVLLTRDGYGHTSYEVSTCISGHVDSYLFNLTVPAAGITCPSNA